MKQVFNNDDISIVYTTDRNKEDSLNGHFYVSNNTKFQLINIKLTLLVTKSVTLKVLSTSGTTLEPQKRLGITKVNN